MATKSSNFYNKKLIEEGKKAYIPQTLHDIEYVERFNAISQSMKISKAETIRLLLDHYYRVF